MCFKWWTLFLFCVSFGLLHLFASINCLNELTEDSTEMNNSSATVNWTTTVEEGTTVPPENATLPEPNVEPVHCKTNKDCEPFQNDDPTVIYICSNAIGLCIVAHVEQPDGVTAKPTTLRPMRSTTTGNARPPTKTSSTPTPNTGGTGGENKQTDFSNVPYVVWILMVIPFVSIIVLGVLCGRRLKAQSLNIQENLMRTTINGVHVDQLLSQRELLNSLAISRPPPTYEKATGEIPPSYETFLQALQDKRPSIFNCDSLMTETDKEADNISGSISSGSSLRSLPVNHHRTGRGSPLIFAISHTNVP